MTVEELRARYYYLVVTACEWRGLGLSDPRVLADQVFHRLNPRNENNLRDIFKQIDKVVMDSLQRNAEGASIVEWLRKGSTFQKPVLTATDGPLKALSRMSNRDRSLLQHRFWDELTDEETAEVLGRDVHQIRERLAKAGSKYVRKLSRSQPEILISDIPDVIRDLKPGKYHRYPPQP